ncbi:unnamed protein product, partial [Iphiclides podalirius]
MSANVICALVCLVAVSSVVRRTNGTVNCPIACRRCRAGEDHSALLEVYCAMCEECRGRRRQMVDEGINDARHRASKEDYEADCPAPPPCDTDVEDAIVPLKTTVATTTTETTTTTTTTTTTPSTTTRRPCPPVAECKKRKRPHAPMACCLPMCAYPPSCPETSQQLTAAYTTPSTPETTTKDYFYAYVGVPKDLLRR